MSKNPRIVVAELNVPDASGLGNEAWLRARTDEDGVAYGLAEQHLNAMLRLFSLSQAEEDAEAELALRCADLHAVGFAGRRPILYRYLEGPLPLPPVRAVRKANETLGWSSRDVSAYADAVAHNALERVHRRMQAAAGRLLATPGFLADRDQVRATWRQLPASDRPALPLYPPPTLPKLPVGQGMKKAPASAARFWQELDAFCRRWQVQHMATWTLPLPLGPEWTGILTPAEQAEQGVIQTRLPFHFPLRAGDGAGAAAVAAHASAAAERGVEDHGSWETYAALLTLAHWEHVLVDRYDRSQRVRKFVENMEFLFADMLGMSVDRVHRLRKLRSSLRSGNLASLSGRR